MNRHGWKVTVRIDGKVSDEILCISKVAANKAVNTIMTGGLYVYAKSIGRLTISTLKIRGSKTK